MVCIFQTNRACVCVFDYVLLSWVSVCMMEVNMSTAALYIVYDISIIYI